MKEISGDISATYQPGILTKVWYMLYNLIRGIAGAFSFTWFRIWHPMKIGVHGNHTPMRVLTDLSFQELVKKHLKQKNISVLDIGAGSAYFREQLANMGYSGSYTGVDVYTHKKYSDDAVQAFNSQLVISSIEKFTPQQKYDLVMSVTALEHIPDDFKAVEVAREAQAQDGIQIHIVPGFWSLFMYLLHGYRQYTRGRLGKMFAGQDYTIYRLGGFPSFIVHFICVTIPERFLHIHVRDRAFYPKFARRAIKLDKLIPFCGYAFVIIVKNKTHD